MSAAPIVERAAAFVEHAHRYAGLGWALVRCDGKKPKGEGWQHTQPDDPDHAAGKWSEWGRRWNIGVVCGPSGLAILDVDRDDSEQAVRDLLGELPATPTVRTGRGRLQVYFRDPGGLEKIVRDGLELRVGGHQCVAPPSVHPDTEREYVWLPGLEPWTVALAELPAALVDFFTEARGPNGRAAPIGEKIAYGQQHHTLVSLAGSMRQRGHDADEIFAALWQVNINRCERPGPEENIRQIAESAERWPAGTLPGSRPPSTNGAQGAELEGEEVSEDWAVRFGGLSHADALAKEIPATALLVEDVIEAGTVGQIAGLPETHKSFLAVEIAFKVAAGGRVFGEFDVVQRGPVGYWWQDDSEANELRRLQSYAERHGFGRDLPIRWHLNEGLLLPDHLPALREEVERESQRLVVLDSLYNFIQGQGFALKDEQVAEVLRAIKADVCDPTGVTVLTIDHSPWPSENTRGQRRAYGSVFKAAAIRWAVHLERDGENLWSEAHGNNLRGFKRRLTVWDEETLELRLHEAEHGYQKAPPADIAEWIRGRESGTASPAEIREAFGIEHHALAKRRAELAELGIAYVPAGGKSRYQVASDPEVSGHYPAPADPSIARERGDSLFSCGFESNPRPPALEGARGAETAHLQGDSEPAPPRSLKGDPSAGAGVPPEAGDSA